MDLEITHLLVRLTLTGPRRSNVNASLLLGHEGGATYDEPGVADDPTVRNSLTSPQLAPALPPPSPLHHEIGEIESAAAKTAHVISDAIEETIILNPDEIGIPNEGKWGLVSARQSRSCFQHGEKEFLLHCVDRWMRVSDFDVYEAKTRLEGRLQKYQREPWSLDPGLLNSRAECNSTLWSHLDTPKQRGKFGGEDIYLCRWKFCWTPETNIDDKEWVQASCGALEDGRRRSPRARKTEGVAEKWEQMRVVVNLEEYL
jgi:hypothetical protein